MQYQVEGTLNIREQVGCSGSQARGEEAFTLGG